MLNTSIKDAPNFIRISIFSMKKSYLKIAQELMSKNLCDTYPDFIISIYYHQAIDLIESKIYKPLLLSQRRNHLKMCSVYFLKIKVWNILI